MTALLDPETRSELREKTEHVEDLVERSVDEYPSSDEELSSRSERRGQWLRRVQDGVLDLVNELPAGTEDYEARQLLLFLVELGQAIADDPEVEDRDGRIQLAAARMLDVLQRMVRCWEHSALEDPQVAARYVLEKLGKLPPSDIATLFGVSERTIGKWKAGEVVRKNGDRVELVAQLVSYLRHSFTQVGIKLWFSNPSDLLGGSSPLDLMDQDLASSHPALIAFARGGRGQLAS